MITRVQVQCRSEVRRGNKVGGYASVFGPIADLGPDGREAIDSRAFDQALRASDTRALWNHDPMMLLGRRQAGTLRLSVDSTGLEYEADLPDTGYARDLRALLERGDVDSASFGFVAGAHHWDVQQRATVHTSVAQLVDVGPVTFPAYAEATAEVRSQNLGRASSVRSQLIRARARATLEGVRP